MNPQGFRKFLTFFTLLIFLGSKALSYHSTAHSSDEDQMNCDLCELAVLQDITPALEAPTFELGTVTQQFLPILYFYDDPDPETHVTGLLFSRPPPKLS